MKIFPTRLYEFKLQEEQEAAWEHLKENTKGANSLVSVRTDRKFIGIVKPGYFRLISSAKGKGALCVFEGSMTNEATTGVIKVEVHKAFRILISVWLVFVLCGTIISLVINGPWAFVRTLVTLGAIIVVLRFILLKLVFNSVSDNTIEDLCNVMNIELTEVPA